MAEISLEDLMKGKRQEAAPVSLEKVEPAQEIERVTQAVESLTPEEQRKVAEIKENIDLMDTSVSLTFGAAAQKEIADFSDSILSHVRVKARRPPSAATYFRSPRRRATHCFRAWPSLRKCS